MLACSFLSSSCLEHRRLQGPKQVSRSKKSFEVIAVYKLHARRSLVHAVVAFPLVHSFGLGARVGMGVTHHIVRSYDLDPTPPSHPPRGLNPSGCVQATMAHFSVSHAVAQSIHAITQMSWMFV